MSTGLPREVTWRGISVSTGIYKGPVEGRVPVRKLNLGGDREDDLTVHGDGQKAVYCYPSEHGYWKRELPGRQLPRAVFGENFTTEGLLEDSAHLGDRFAVGAAEFLVTPPRLPGYKLGVRFQDDGMVKQFLGSGRSGFYFAVMREGQVGAGDEIKVTARDSNGVAISEMTRLHVAKRYAEEDVTSMWRALRVAELPQSSKGYFRERLQRMNG